MIYTVNKHQELIDYLKEGFEYIESLDSRLEFTYEEDTAVVYLFVKFNHRDGSETPLLSFIMSKGQDDFISMSEYSSIYYHYKHKVQNENIECDIELYNNIIHDILAMLMLSMGINMAGNRQYLIKEDYVEDLILLRNRFPKISEVLKLGNI